MFSGVRITMIGVLMAATTAIASAQLTFEQKLHDFQNLASLYAKHYAPLQWKRQLLGYDALDLVPWLGRIRRSLDDLDYLEICAEYVASLNDAHSAFYNRSSFTADSGIFLDIYEGRVLIDNINRQLLPARLYPFQIGDELLSVDGKPVDQLIREFSRFQKLANLSSTRRNAADAIGYRVQSSIPRAHELPEESDFEIRSRNGGTRAYKIRWQRFGFPLQQIGPVPPITLLRLPRAASGDTPDYPDLLARGANWRLRPDNPLRTRRSPVASEESEPSYVLGVDRRTPAFAPPPNFVLRLGRAGDFHFTGTYTAGGKRLGYLRIPSFAPPNNAVAVRELVNEIQFFQANTDGLVADVMRNSGGGCYLQTAASLLMTKPYTGFGEWIRPSLDHLNAYQGAIDQAKAAGAPQWVIDLLEFYLVQIKQAYQENRGITGPIPACSLGFENQPLRDQNGNLFGYSKPLIVLTDEFTTSAAEIFAAIIQDNKRGLIVGARTMGAGGSARLFDSTVYSESAASVTESLVVRQTTVSVPPYPAAPFIENIGVQPDVYLELMTEANLLNRGLTFVQDFTGVLVDWIERQ